jgi:hypothetical protein
VDGAGIAVRLVIPYGGVSGTDFPGRGAAGTAAPPAGYDAFARQAAAAAAGRPAPG